MSDSPALDALRAKATAEKARGEKKDFCGKHMRNFTNGKCLACEAEKNYAEEMKRREKAIEDGDEKWIGKTCFKKGRQTKKYVRKMMGLTGKQYRKLNIKARRMKNK